MKKRILTIAVLAMSAVLMAAVLVGCGVNHSSAEGIAIEYVKASGSLEINKILDCFYFPDDDAKNEVKDYFESGKEDISEYVDFKVSFSNVKYTKEESLSAEELAELTILYSKDVTDGERGVVKFDIKITYKVTEVGITVEGSDELKDVSETVTTIKIDGKWYIDYFNY